MKRISRNSALRLRDAWLSSLVGSMVNEMFDGLGVRECMTCGRTFRCKHHNHYFCDTECRKRWYKGMFVRNRRRKAGSR